MTPPQKFHRVRRLDRLVTSSLTESGLPPSGDDKNQTASRLCPESTGSCKQLPWLFPDTSYPFPTTNNP